MLWMYHFEYKINFQLYRYQQIEIAIELVYYSELDNRQEEICKLIDTLKCT